MYLAAHLALLLAMLASLLGGALACMEAWHGQRHKLPWLKRCQDTAVILMACASAIRLASPPAFAWASSPSSLAIASSRWLASPSLRAFFSGLFLCQ